MKTKPKSSKSPDTARTAPQTQAGVTECCGDMRQSMIAEAAYFRSQRRGFCGSADDALNDWLEAETEIERTLARPPDSSSPNEDGQTR